MNDNQCFRLGLFGRFEADAAFLGFLEALAEHYHTHGWKLCIMFAVLSKRYYKIGAHLLDLKMRYPELQLEIVVDLMQHLRYYQKAVRELDFERKRILDAADRVHVIEEKMNIVVFINMLRLIASHTDAILFASYTEFDLGLKKLSTLSEPPKAIVWDVKRRVKVHQTYHIRRYYRSIEFIRSRHFRVQADEIPDDLLAAWSIDDVNLIAHHYGINSQEEELLKLLDPENPSQHLLVFLYAYSYNTLWSFGESRYDLVKTRFAQYQDHLSQIAAARKSGRPVGRFDVFDFDSYPVAEQLTKVL